ncbi:MAG: ATP-binding protein [Verrucomicrobium sp.]|nr:ATP-binding protein [Verrucomicrobium sp.]
MSEAGVTIPPRPSVMVESLRSVGYETTTALADIIDNSISAGADEIRVNFHWAGRNSFITIWDNGNGMDQAELIEAMRLGSKDPREKRKKSDLGRFGLGLKTASFSQCLKLTVITKRADEETISLCWDLDHVRKTESWEVTPGRGDNLKSAAKSIRTSGTVVLWENLDRVCDSESDDANIFSSQESFLGLAATVETHLGITFHRFISGPGKIHLQINGNTVKPWDPFITGHPACQNPEQSEIHFKGERIIVSCHILPHHTKLPEHEWQEAGGSAGWLANQGFYVYRNKRLLVAGDWLGLGPRKEEHYKLARISVDIPNTIDRYWDLDVKKSRAVVPHGLRRRLTQLAKATRDRAAAVYRHRGKIIGREKAEASFVWIQKTVRSKLHYEISRKHPTVAASLKAAGERKSEMESLLRLIEESIPVPAIVLECSQKEDALAGPFEGVPEIEIYKLFAQCVESIIKSGRSREDAMNHLRNAEPFNLYPAIMENLLEYMEKQQ